MSAAINEVFDSIDSNNGGDVPEHGGAVPSESGAIYSRRSPMIDGVYKPRGSSSVSYSTTMAFTDARKQPSR